MVSVERMLVALTFIVVTAVLVLPAAAQAPSGSDEEIACPFCGVRTPATGRFCGACGKGLPSLPAEPPIGPPPAAPLTAPESPLPAATDTSTARALFESGLELMTGRQYGLAALCFKQIVETYPGSTHARHSAELRAACEELARGTAPEPRKELSTGPAILSGALGGILGVAGLILLAIALS